MAETSNPKTPTPEGPLDSSLSISSQSKLELPGSNPAPNNSLSASRVYIPLIKLYGTLRYIGEIHIRPGVWAGIELEKEGAGKNDGSVDGRVYFKCAPNTGIFVPSSGFEFVNVVDKNSKNNLEVKFASPLVNNNTRTSFIPRPTSSIPVPTTYKKNISVTGTETPIKSDFISAIPRVSMGQSTPPSTPLLKSHSVSSPRKVGKVAPVAVAAKYEVTSFPIKPDSPNNLSPLSPPVPQEKLEGKLKRLTLTVSPNELRDYISQSFNIGDEHKPKSEKNNLNDSPLIQGTKQAGSLPSPLETPRPLSNLPATNRSSISNFDRDSCVISQEVSLSKVENEGTIRSKDTAELSNPVNEFKLNNLQMQINVVNSELALKRKQYNDLQDRYESLQNDYAVVLNESKELKFYLSVAEQAHLSCKPKQLELEKRISELEKLLETKEFENSQLKAKLKISKAGRIQTMSEYADSIEILMKDLRHLQVKYDELVKQVKQSEADLALSRSASILSVAGQSDTEIKQDDLSENE